MKNLFNIDHESPKLDKAKADTFHPVVSRILWVMKRSRPDLETAVSFLCTRVYCCTEEDWSKLHRVLQFMNQKRNDTRIIAADNLGEMYNIT